MNNAFGSGHPFTGTSVAKVKAEALAEPKNPVKDSPPVAVSKSNSNNFEQAGGTLLSGLPGGHAGYGR